MLQHISTLESTCMISVVFSDVMSFWMMHVCRHFGFIKLPMENIYKILQVCLQCPMQRHMHKPRYLLILEAYLKIQWESLYISSVVISWEMSLIEIILGFNCIFYTMSRTDIQKVKILPPADSGVKYFCKLVKSNLLTRICKYLPIF